VSRADEHERADATAARKKKKLSSLTPTRLPTPSLSRPATPVVARRVVRVSAVEVEAEAPAPPTPSNAASSPEPAPTAADAGAGADDKKEPRTVRAKKTGGRPRRVVTLKLEDIVVGQELQGTVVSSD